MITKFILPLCQINKEEGPIMFRKPLYILFLSLINRIEQNSAVILSSHIQYYAQNVFKEKEKEKARRNITGY